MKNKGFTLIELLAVILILGIIALIAIPIIGNIINDAKESSFKASVTTLTRKIEENCQLEKLSENKLTKEYTIRKGIIIPSIDVKGKIPTSGDIKVDDECNASYSNVTDWVYVAIKTTEAEINIMKQETNRILYPNGSIVYLNPITLESCTNYHVDNSLTNYNGTDAKKTTENQTACLKWYIFNDDIDNASVNLILDHNTYGQTTYNKDEKDGSKMGAEVIDHLTKLNNAWKTEARLISANDIASIVGTTWTGDKEFYFDGKEITPSSTCTEGNTSKCDFGWLYDRTGLTCENTGCSNNSDVETYGYWTNTGCGENQNRAFGVSMVGRLKWNYVSNRTTYGIRPVITVSKSSIN